MASTLDKLEFFQNLYRIRRAEEVIADEYRKGIMKTPTHLGIGQEAVAVGVCKALSQADVVYSHHRCHTHYLAKGGSLLALFSELLGRVSGCSSGRGGSVHIVDTKVNFYGSSPILGHSLALATGSALSFKMDRNRRVAVAFFGEGAFDEGSVWESLNFAAIRKLPVLFICENNLYATESPLSVRMPPNTDICTKVKAFGVNADQVDGNDVLSVYSSAKLAIKECRNGNGPQFIECMTYRWREHVGPMWDYEAGRTYRLKGELDMWMDKCPLKRLEADLMQSNAISEVDLVSLKNRIDAEIFSVMDTATKCEWPSPIDLFKNVY